MTARDSSISQNTGRGTGGGIDVSGSALLVDCALVGNSAGQGGGGDLGGITTLMNCTVSGDSATAGNGGGLLVDDVGYSTTVTGCTFLDNSCLARYSSGGAIATSQNSVLTITNSALTGNTARAGGGLNARGPISLVSSTITGNSATNGGGIFSDAGLATFVNGYHAYVTPDTLSITDCVISSNSAKSFGGGAFNIGGMTLSDCTISGNTAGSGGGGIADMSQYISNTLYSIPVMAAFNGCTISGNSAASYGGGILNQGGLTLTNSAVTGNSAKIGGGIANPILSQAHLYRVGGTDDIANSQATITGSSIAGNSASSYGGGIMNQGTLTLANCTLSGNTATKNGGAIANLALSLFYPQGGAPSYASAVANAANSTFYGNTSLYGGAISNELAELGLENDTVTANRTTALGNYAAAVGTITSVGDIVLTNTLIAGNSKGASPSTASGDVAGTIDSKSASNLIGDGDLLKGISRRIPAQPNWVDERRCAHRSQAGPVDG